jgi:transcriptional regulator with XRE-family HTH domain
MGEPSFYPERLIEVRKAKGWSPAELAKRCGFKGQSTVSRLENGKRSNPGAAILGRLCKALEISSDYLIGKRPDLDNVSIQRATAHLTLDTYVGRKKISDDEEHVLRAIAERHPAPPVFVEGWVNLHQSLSIVGMIPSAERTEPTGGGRRIQRTIRRGRLSGGRPS